MEKIIFVARKILKPSPFFYLFFLIFPLKHVLSNDTDERGSAENKKARQVFVLQLDEVYYPDLVRWDGLEKYRDSLNEDSPLKESLRELQIKLDFAWGIIRRLWGSTKGEDQLRDILITHPQLGTLLILSEFHDPNFKIQLERAFEREEAKDYYTILPDSYAGAGGTIYYDLRNDFRTVHDVFDRRGLDTHMNGGVLHSSNSSAEERFAALDQTAQVNIHFAADEAYRTLFGVLRRELEEKIRDAGVFHLLIENGILFDGGPQVLLADSEEEWKPRFGVSSKDRRVRHAEYVRVFVRDSSSRAQVAAALGISLSYANGIEGEYGTFDIAILTLDEAVEIESKKLRALSKPRGRRGRQYGSHALEDIHDGRMQSRLHQFRELYEKRLGCNALVSSQGLPHNLDDEPN